MAGDSVDVGTGRPDLKLSTPNPLAHTQSNALAASNEINCSDDEAIETHDLHDEDARNAIGVSIGQEQLRLTSPKTPATEKQAAIERAGGFFGGIDGTLAGEPEEYEEEPPSEALQNELVTQDDGEQRRRRPSSPVPERSSGTTSVRMPSPWRAGPREFPSDNDSKSGFLAAFSFGRRRADTGPETTSESWHRSFISSLPSLPKNLSFSLPFSNSHEDIANGEAKATQSPSVSHWKIPNYEGRRDFDPTPPLARQRSKSTGPLATSQTTTLAKDELEEANASLGELPSGAQLQRIHSRQGMLRRSTSDGSLVTTRTLSMVSSLGDDSRFNNVHDQVNSRFKAIKDSWQDSNIRLPSIPKNLSVSSFTPDFLRERSGSLNRRKSSSRNSLGEPHSSIELVPTGSFRPEDPMTRRPYHSAKAAVADAATRKNTQHPHFDQALERLEGDIVVLGGYRGSVLRSADPPHRQLWVPVKVGLNLRKVNLEVGLEDDADQRSTESIIPDGMLTHIGPVDISRRLLKRLRTCENALARRLRVHDYGYDWRLHPTHLSDQLVTFLESLPCNQPGVAEEERGATVIAHSLGGLITRHAVNRRPELFRGVVYAGVPKTCVNILGPMRNGDEVLLSSRVLTAQVNFTIRTSFALLPLDGRCFFDKNTNEEYPVDFFDPQTWIDYRLSPCIARPLPPLNYQDRPSGISAYVSSMANALPSLPLPGRKNSTAHKPKSPLDLSKTTKIAGAAEPDTNDLQTTGGSAAIAANGNMDHSHDPDAEPSPPSTSISTAVTLPREACLDYLHRTLASVKKFKQHLAFDPLHAAANLYPPIAVIYGKSTPTVYGAKVDGREGIKRADAYDELAFASGDGVVLARAAMVPEGYKTVRGGMVSSSRGHVTLLGDLEAVGRCLGAVGGARRRGVGLGRSREG